MPSVLVTDSTFDTLDIERAILEPLGCTVESRQCKTRESLLQAVPAADFVITQFAPLSADVIRAMTRVRLIVRYGIGVDNVDLEAARATGIPVCNVPDYCINEVADHALAFILAATRQVVGNTLAARAGRWSLPVPLAAMKTLRELTVGVIGCGRIGSEVVRRLIPFKSRVLVHDPAVDPGAIESLGAQAVASVDEVIRRSDIVTLHCPSTEKTRRMIDAHALELFKPGAILVNLSRGDLVDTPALVSALNCGRLGGAALDVCDPEPIPAGHALLSLPNVVLAPHVASASVSAVRTLRESAAEAIARTLRGEPPPNVVNGVDRPRF